MLTTKTPTELPEVADLRLEKYHYSCRYQNRDSWPWPCLKREDFLFFLAALVACLLGSLRSRIRRHCLLASWVTFNPNVQLIPSKVCVIVARWLAPKVDDGEVRGSSPWLKQRSKKLQVIEISAPLVLDFDGC